MDQQVKRVKREIIKHGAILDMYEDTMELPDGKQETWDFISHRKDVYKRQVLYCL